MVIFHAHGENEKCNLFFGLDRSWNKLQMYIYEEVFLTYLLRLRADKRDEKLFQQNVKKRS